MNIRELYYINKFKPIYNTADKYDDNFDMPLSELEWKNLNHKVNKNLDTEEISPQNKLIINEKFKTISNIIQYIKGLISNAFIASGINIKTTKQERV